MSRETTTFRFVEVDASALEQELTELYETLTGGSVATASPEMLFIKWITSILVQERAQINFAADQNIPSRAVGENLDALGELFFLTERPEAQSAQCVMRFTISEPQGTSILVPAGTRVTDEDRTLIWETTEDAIIPIGDTYVDATVVCQTPGTVGNGWAVGRITTIVDVFDYYTSCTNTTASDGGSDRLSDDEYYELMRSSLDGYSTAGAIGGYEFHAKKVSSEIADVVVTSPSPCEVRIYALMADGTAAGTVVKNAILAECNADTVRPLTDHVAVEDPEAVTYNIDLTYWLPPDGDAAEITAAITDAVNSYIAWQGSKLGRNIIPSQLIADVMHAGAARVEVREPVYQALREGGEMIAISEEETEGSEEEETVVSSAPQYALIGTTTLVNGGYEDG